MSKVSTIGDSVVETNVKKAIEKHEAEVKAEHEAEVKKLSSGVEKSVISKTDKAIEIKGIKDRDTLITNEGEVAFKDVELSDNDARLFSYARGMASDEASLYYEQYDGKADVEQYTNDFNRAVYYAKHSGFTENYILEHKGSLSGKQVSAIYKNTVMAEARVKEAEHNKLISTTANNTPYTGYIDDSIFDYKNTSASGKINWNSLNQRQKNSVDFLKVFAAKSGMNLVFTPYSKTSNGAFDIKDNTIYVSAYAGILFEKNKLRDTIIPTASHEITHWMEEKSPELYVKLKDIVLDALEVAMGKSQAELISDEIARLDRTHKNKKHTEKDAINEIVARACEDMLSMSEEGRKLFDSMTEEEKKTFVGKVKEILENLMKWIDDFLSSYKSDTREARSLQNYKDKLEEMSKIWDQMLVRSIEVNQAFDRLDAESQQIIDEYKKRLKEKYGHDLQLSGKVTEFTQDDYKQNCKALVQLDSVANLNGTELDGDLPLREKVRTLFEIWGYVVKTDRFGNVELKESSIHSDIRHGSTRNKITAYAAIPDVLKNGVVIDVQKKNFGNVERIIVAAPITITNKPYFMGVMIQRDAQTNRLYLHDVVIKKEASEYHSEHLNTTGSPDTENLFMTEVLEKAISVGYSVSQPNGKINDQIVNNDDLQHSDKNPDLSEDDLSDYIKSGKTLHTRNKKQRMLESGKKPILTSYVEFKEFISNVINGKAPGEVRAFKKVGRRLAEAIQNKRNSLNMLGKYLELNADNLRESYKRHSEAKEIGDIPLSEQDFERIPEYLDEFDDVLCVNTYNNKIEVHLYKETEEGYIRILTVVSSERNSLQITKLTGVSKEKFEKKYAKK